MKKTNLKTRVTALTADWYKNPAMVGHDVAIKQYRYAWEELKPHATTKLQKEIISIVIDWKSQDWHYWTFLSKKYISHVKHCLKGLKRGDSWMDLLLWVTRRSGMLVDNLSRYLEVKAYDENPEKYLDYFSHWYTSMGMPKYEAYERLKNRVSGYRSKLGL